jgi:hypothetical protein
MLLRRASEGRFRPTLALSSAGSSDVAVEWLFSYRDMQNMETNRECIQPFSSAPPEM